MKRYVTLLRLPLSLVVAFSLVAFSFAQVMPVPAQAQELVSPNTQKACELAKETRLPEQDRPTSAQRKDLAHCVSEDLYYGYNGHPDPAKARLCAYLEMESKRQSSDEPVLGGEAMLMMIYANGRGAERNFDVALKLACDVDSAPAEMDFRIEHLQKLKRERWTGTDFDLCDDITSGLMQGACAAREEKFSAVERQRRLEAITSKWSDRERSSLQQLQRAADDFFKMRASNEVDLSGTGRGASYVSELGGLNDDFVDSLEKCEKGQRHGFSSGEFAAADAELNRAYAALEKAGNLHWGTVTMEGIRKTERAWVRYRDAWAAFGQVRYPEVSQYSWKTWLTRERTKMLQDFAR